MLRDNRDGWINGPVKSPFLLHVLIGIMTKTGHAQTRTKRGIYSILSIQFYNITKVMLMDKASGIFFPNKLERKWYRTFVTILPKYEILFKGGKNETFCFHCVGQTETRMTLIYMIIAFCLWVGFLSWNSAFSPLFRYHRQWLVYKDIFQYLNIAVNL